MCDNDEDDEEHWRKGHARLNRTVAALIDRGIDHELARTLRSAGWTLGTLKQLSAPELVRLGIPGETAKALLSEQRPPVPFADLAAVLIANRFTCCVCHDPERSVVVHHIVDWATSRDHSRANLAVVCLDHHDKAHKTGGLTQNLSPQLVRQSKAEWEAKVASLDTRAILDASATNSDAWWLFNHARLFSLADDLRIDLTTVEGYRAAFHNGVIDRSGMLRPRDQNNVWMYAGGDGIALQRFVAGVLRAVLEQLTVYNVSNDLDRSTLSSIIRPGHFLFLQGTYYFKNKSDQARGPGQAFTGTRKVNGVEIYFTADRWEAVANSAHCSWLHGRQNAACLMRVIDVGRSPEGALIVGTTALAVGAPLDGLKTREYANAPYRPGFFIERDEDEEAFAAEAWENGADDPANYPDLIETEVPEEFAPAPIRRTRTK